MSGSSVLTLKWSTSYLVNKLAIPNILASYVRGTVESGINIGIKKNGQ